MAGHIITENNQPTVKIHQGFEQYDNCDNIIMVPYVLRLNELEILSV